MNCMDIYFQKTVSAKIDPTHEFPQTDFAVFSSTVCKRQQRVLNVSHLLKETALTVKKIESLNVHAFVACTFLMSNDLIKRVKKL